MAALVFDQNPQLTQRRYSFIITLVKVFRPMRILSNYLFFTSGPRIESPQTDLLPLCDDHAGYERQFTIFAMLWAIATLFHMAHSSLFDSQLDYALLTVAAFAVIFRPGIFTFILLITLQVFDALFRMPFTTNHWIFTAFVNLSILYSILFIMLRSRSFRINGGSLLKVVAPVLRIELLVLYSFAVFHKLNSGFFTPESSCATELLHAQHFDSIISLPPTVIAFNAHFTILVEAAIPLMLCFRKTRNLGILTGIFFHCVLAFSTYNAFYDFSSMILAIYVLFTAPDFSHKIFERLSKMKVSAAGFFHTYRRDKVIFLVLAIVALLVVLYLPTKKLDNFREVHLYFFWTVYSIAAILLFISFWPRNKTHSISLTLPHKSLIIFPIVVFLNGICPYVGLKTENSYAMFSNLRTEGGKTNHFIVPASLQVFSFQKDVVEIISSTDPVLQRFAIENKALVLFEFRNYIYERKPEKIEYRLNGNHHIYDRSQPDKNLSKNPYVLSKLMKFRPFSVAGAQPCLH
jgi:hypothetical protein